MKFTGNSKYSTETVNNSSKQLGFHSFNFKISLPFQILGYKVISPKFSYIWRWQKKKIRKFKRSPRPRFFGSFRTFWYLYYMYRWCTCLLMIKSFYLIQRWRLSFPTDHDVTPVAGPIFETKNRAIFLRVAFPTRKRSLWYFFNSTRSRFFFLVGFVNLRKSTAANWVSFDLNVSCSSCWGYSLINTLKLRKSLTEIPRNARGMVRASAVRWHSPIPADGRLAELACTGAF